MLKVTFSLHVPPSDPRRNWTHTVHMPAVPRVGDSVSFEDVPGALEGEERVVKAVTWLGATPGDVLVVLE